MTHILALSIEGKYFIIFYDTSHFGLSVVLMYDKNLIIYASMQLKVHESNYLTHELKLEIIVYTLKIWRHYLYGVKHKVLANHHSLKHVVF